ncbi:MAG: xanthan lyase [Bacteroidaceae bacterium]|nr:xanthan lyase [Bacteroidaceae bacterium]
MKLQRTLLGAALLALIATPGLMAQNDTPELRKQIGEVFDQVSRRLTNVGRVKIDSIRTHKKTLTVYAGDYSSYIPYREDNVAEIYAGVKNILPQEWKKLKLQLLAEGDPIENLIPIGLRSGKVKDKTFKTKNVTPLTTNLDLPTPITRGLQNRHIAMWQSHGKYYEPKLDRWEWQRARIFQTVEDLYTQSYVLPFLVPMLENAGAHVLMPRERDANPIEVIVDNDGVSLTPPQNDNDDKYERQSATNINLSHASTFRTTDGEQPWTDGQSEGFAMKRLVYINHENPFKEGTYRQTLTTRKGAESKAEWIPQLPETREYAVYVSYQSLPNSTEQARYTVIHQGRKTTVSVNQQMGGGTWIYLGSYRFDKSDPGTADNNKVVLSNLTDEKKAHLLTADAVKFGGGIGNVGRFTDMEKVKDGQFDPITLEDAITSNCPRFLEGARYWMQWAGAPDSIYDLTQGKNDYVDDYKDRGLWVNWLAGGSEVNPKEEGLRIPLDLSFAFHSDAGTTLNDQTVGTLAIYDSEHYEGEYFNGASTKMNHQLADLVQSNITQDVRRMYEPKWNRRQIWNKPYFEAWMPKVPAMLLELLSHQNFADMRYGLDPRFRFTVSRAIYKAMLQFISAQRGETYVVQPLPVQQMALKASAADEVELSWTQTPDTLEPTAVADRYIVYQRIGSGDWDNGTLVSDTRFTAKLQPGKVCSYKVVAVNDGGRSFDSEILSAGLASNDMRQQTVMIVNGFNRIGAPADFEAPDEASKRLAGFLPEVDFGVPYLKDISYIGGQKEYRRNIPWMDDDAGGFGDSYGNYEKEVIAGNTFDYPATHGEALLAAGKNFLSTSQKAVETGITPLQPYQMVDLILGKECQTKMGHGKLLPLTNKVYSKLMQEQLTAYLKAGGRLLATGSYVASDIWDNPLRIDEQLLNREELKEDKKFVEDILKYTWRVGQAAKGGKVGWVKSGIGRQEGAFAYHNDLNSECYAVQSPDAIEPAAKQAYTVMRSTENNLSAAVAYDGDDYRTFVMGIPFETVKSQAERHTLMKQIVDFLLK